MTNRVATLNAKAGKHPKGLRAGGKRLGLKPANVRIRAALRRFEDAGVTLVAVQEFSAFQARVFGDGRWKALRATPNDTFPGGVEIGNGIVYDSRVWTLVDNGQMQVGVLGRVLSMPWAQLLHRPTGAQIRFLCCHFPAGKRAKVRAAKKACEAAVREFIEASWHSPPWVVAGDMNMGTAFPDWPGVRNKVDHIRSPDLELTDPITHGDFKGTISDHAAVSVTVELIATEEPSGPKPVTPERIATAFAHGLVNVPDAALACREAGLPFWAACALLEKESGGRNVFGHDKGGALAGFEEDVTEGAWRVFRWMVLDNGHTSNGVGPCQITYAGPVKNGKRDGGFFREMEANELKPWVPHDNMLFGFRLLARYHDELGTWAAAGARYNGSETYGADLVAKMNAWRERLGIKGGPVR